MKELKKISAGKEKRQCYGAVRSCSDAIERKDDKGIRRGRGSILGYVGGQLVELCVSSCHWRPE